MKKIYWFILFCLKNILLRVLTLSTKLINPRNSKILIFFCSPFSKDSFFHNSKYLYLYLKSKQLENYKIIWMCKTIQMKKEFKRMGFKDVYYIKTLKALYYILKAKYFFTDYHFSDLCFSIFLQNAIKVNLWHGIPLKKIEYDDINIYQNYRNLKSSYLKQLYKKIKVKDFSFIVVNSEYEQNCYKTAFLVNEKKLPILGSPRLDILFNYIPNAEVFMKDDYKNIQKMYESGKKLILYMPTFRDTGKNISGWLKSKKLRQILKDNNVVIICKLHPFDKNALDFDLGFEFYKMNSNSDIYPVLKYSDALISDYSSVAFDYLLLDRPIIYHVPDLQEYQETCRGFYTPYEEFAVGEISYNEDELISAMQDVVNGVDNYKEQRKVLRDKMFKYQDGKNCERVVEWIRSLDE